MTDQQMTVLLAMYVMGWETTLSMNREVVWVREKSGLNPFRKWNPTRNIGDAWQIFKKLKEDYKNVSILYNDKTEVWECKVGDDGSGFCAIKVEGKTEEAAIINAGMKAVEDLRLIPQA